MCCRVIAWVRSLAYYPVEEQEEDSFPSAFVPACPPEAKIVGLMQNLIQKKTEQRDLELASRTGKRLPGEIILIGGDAFTTGYLLFQGAQLAKPAISKIAAVAMASLICGEIAGAINIGVAIVSLKESIQAYKNGDKALALRLFLDFVTFSSIGVIMILTSLALKVGALAACGAFFAVNPWLLPVLFFIASVPVLVEVSSRVKKILLNQDLGSQVLADPKKAVGITDDMTPEQLSEKMELLQANIGVNGALETFKLIKMIEAKEDTTEQKKIVAKEIDEWNHAQYVRLAQQVLYLLAFGGTVAALSPKTPQRTINMANNFAMAGANAIPFYMDSFWPFKRNTPIVVPKV